MRGGNERSGSLFSYVDLEARIDQKHPLRMIRMIVNEASAGCRHVAMRRARADGATRIFRLPRQPRATCSSPQCEACGAFGLKSDGVGC
jgi:hypothetical protein